MAYAFENDSVARDPDKWHRNRGAAADKPAWSGRISIDPDAAEYPYLARTGKESAPGSQSQPERARRRTKLYTLLRKWGDRLGFFAINLPF